MSEQTPGNTSIRRKFNPEEKKNIVLRVDRLRADGVKVTEACNQVDIAQSVYSRWKREASGVGPKKKAKKKLPPANGTPVPGLVDELLAMEPTPTGDPLHEQSERVLVIYNKYVPSVLLLMDSENEAVSKCGQLLDELLDEVSTAMEFEN